MTKVTKRIEQTQTFTAPPGQVYAAILNSKQHAAFTGEAAKIEPRVGGTFTCYGDYINGVTLELEPDKCIIQAWRSRNWPKGVYSIVTFKLSAKSGGKTELKFTQIGVPARDYAKKNQGWRTHYWEPLKRFLQAS